MKTLCLFASILSVSLVYASEWDIYFPTPEGATWVYKTTHKKQGMIFDMNVRVDGPWKEGNESGVILTQKDQRGTMKQFLLRRDDGIFIQKIGLSKSYTPEVTTKFTPAAPMLPFPLKEGPFPSWKGHLKVAWVDKSIRYEGKVLGEEEIEVPAGKFKCIKVFFDQWRDNDHIQETAWYAKDVGQVKYDGGEYVKELKSYKTEK